jgi:prepilin signal peptidase PulO-like enzyme (type II secretory pathway)
MTDSRGQENRQSSVVPYLLQLGVGAVLGFVIWLPTFPGEAWDRNPLYSVFVFGAGILAALVRPSTFYWGAAGVALGQTAYLQLVQSFVDRTAPMLPALLAVLIFGTFQAFAGGAIVAAVSIIRRKPRATT